MLFIIKWGASSQWSTSLYCSMRNSAKLTTGKMHSTLPFVKSTACHHTFNRPKFRPHFSLEKCSEFRLPWRFWVNQWYFVIVLVKSDFPIFGLILSHEKSLMANWDYVWFKSVTLKYRIKSYSVYMWPHPTDSVGPRRETRCFKCRTLRLSFDYKRS